FEKSSGFLDIYRNIVDTFVVVTDYQLVY
ncbi:hypothetical protein PPOP_2708, partial [Paenibacillus popilliae ATCC 14706]